jgi:hypothetical protein
MTSVLYIEESIVTGEILVGAHSGEREVCVNETAIVTPTGWDFLRNSRLRLIRSSVTKKPVSSRLVKEKTDQYMMDGLGRCNQPDCSSGCIDEEFGSGFVEPTSCQDCAIHELKRKGDNSANCNGCNRRVLLDQLSESADIMEPEQLIREVTAVVTKRLER